MQSCASKPRVIAGGQLASAVAFDQAVTSAKYFHSSLHLSRKETRSIDDRLPSSATFLGEAYQHHQIMSRSGWSFSHHLGEGRLIVDYVLT